jgi:hypothetical protein
MLARNVVTNCCFQGVDEMFGERTAEKDLRRYRKRGPSKPTRMLLEAFQREGTARATKSRSGAGSALTPNAVRSASRWGIGRWSR